MGLTKSTTAETILWDQPKQVPMSLMRVAGSFKATNNAPDVYKTNCIDHWEHIKAPLTRQKALPRKALTSQYQLQWLESKATYIKPSHGQHKVHKHSKRHLLLFCYSILFYKEFPYSDFGIGDVVAGTTPVTTFKKLSFHIRNHQDESLDPSGHIQLNWRSYASSVILIKMSQAILNYYYYKMLHFLFFTVALRHIYLYIYIYIYINI